MKKLISLKIAIEGVIEREVIIHAEENAMVSLKKGLPKEVKSNLPEWVDADNLNALVKDEFVRKERESKPKTEWEKFLDTLTPEERKRCEKSRISKATFEFLDCLFNLFRR